MNAVPSGWMIARRCLAAWVALCLSVVPLLAQGGIGAVPQEIHAYRVDSEFCRARTALLRAEQGDTQPMDLGEEIVFVLNDGIWVQFEDGTGRRKIISRGSGYHSFWHPAWSLDGTRIAFGAQHTDKRYVDLVVANADGSDPQVILTLNQGYYTSLIQSTSWHWANDYIMFNYVWDDSGLNSLAAVCTIRQDGADFAVGPGPDQFFSQYEPISGSSRYAYLASGTPFDWNSTLHVSNLDGTGDSIWFTHNGVISGLKYVSWKNPSSIYTIVRWWDQYPNQEVLIRVDGGVSYTVLMLSDPNNLLDTITSSPDRSQFYTTEWVGELGTMWLVTLNGNGDPVSWFPEGTGYFPNWRQEIPQDAIGDEGENGPALPHSFALLQNYPNPFNPATTIRFDLPAGEAKAALLAIYDLRGRRVRTLVDRLLEPGSHVFTWDGRDDAGASVASGAYVYRLRWGEQEETRKMLLLK